MTRLPDWNARLSAYIDSVRRAPFEPGVLDCALFAAGAVEAMTGADIAAEWRGYRTLAEGVAKLRRAGFDNHVEALAATLPEIHPSQAALGDILAYAVDGPLGWALGVCNGERAFAMMETGLGTIETLQAKRAFRP